MARLKANRVIIAKLVDTTNLGPLAEAVAVWHIQFASVRNITPGRSTRFRSKRRKNALHLGISLRGLSGRSNAVQV